MQYFKLRTEDGILEYTISHRARVTKRLHMELDDSGGLVVVAPGHWSKRHISATLKQNSARVQRFMTNARQRQVPALEYTNGEKHLFLGEEYPLLISRPVSGRGRIEYAAGEICIYSEELEPEKLKVRLQGWYRLQASVVFAERLQLIASQAPWAVNRVTPLKLRKMKRTWGNCSSKGVIKLNTHLIKAPVTVIDSVIAHELCHLEEMNHGKTFYRLLEKLNPDWKQDRTRLRAEGFTYLRT